MNLPNELSKLKSFSNELYIEDYYENGLKKKLSGYENYHWMPTRSYPEAVTIVENFDFNTAIDYAAAKGFLVHALRQLGKEAFGEDISDYAIENSHPRVRQYLSKPTDNTADLIICKDVMEHIEENEVSTVLNFLYKKCLKNALFVIPLGDNDTFRIREYEVDVTHVTKKDEDWWIDKFRDSGFKLKEFKYSLGSIKEKWIPINSYGNGFFILEK